MRSVFGLLLMLLGSAFGLSRAYAQCATPATTTGGIVLTFDDNSVDTWHATRAIFDAYDARATFFVSNFHALDAAQKQKLRDLADDGHEIAAHSYTHGRATDFSASAYMSQQITPQLVDMAAHGFYPRNFAYPYGADAASTTTALMTEFGFIRDTSYFPNHQASYVTCAQSDRFVAGLGIDYQYGLSNANYGTAFDQAMCDNTNLVLYGHHLAAPSNGSHLYYIDHGRLQTLLSAAQSRGLTFRRLRDLCRWEVAFSGQGSWSPAHDSPRRFDEVTFADFDGDGDDDAFRWTGTQWRVLYNQGGTFYEPSGAEHWAHLNASSIPYDQLVFEDFDGDGRTDIFRTNGRHWYVSYAGTTTWTYLNTSSYPLSRLRFGDFNGDGRADVFTLSGGRWYVSYGGTSTWTGVQSSGYALERLGFGDFDGDGRTDVFVASGGRWYVSDGATSAWRQLNVSGFGADQLAFHDFNGDGRADVLRATGHRWYVSWGGTSTLTLFRFASEQLADVAFADINGDGRTDVIRVHGD